MDACQRLLVGGNLDEIERIKCELEGKVKAINTLSYNEISKLRRDTFAEVLMTPELRKTISRNADSDIIAAW